MGFIVAGGEKDAAPLLIIRGAGVILSDIRRPVIMYMRFREALQGNTPFDTALSGKKHTTDKRRREHEGERNVSR